VEDSYTLEQIIRGDNRMTVEQLRKRAVAAVTICYDLPELSNIKRMRGDLLREYAKQQEEE
jgi:hypothetical protein